MFNSVKLKMRHSKLYLWASNKNNPLSCWTPRATFGLVAGRMWPAGRTLCTTAIAYSSNLRSHACACKSHTTHYMHTQTNTHTHSRIHKHTHKHAIFLRHPLNKTITLGSLGGASIIKTSKHL